VCLLLRVQLIHVARVSLRQLLTLHSVRLLAGCVLCHPRVDHLLARRKELRLQALDLLVLLVTQRRCVRNERRINLRFPLDLASTVLLHTLDLHLQFLSLVAQASCNIFLRLLELLEVGVIIINILV